MASLPYSHPNNEIESGEADRDARYVLSLSTKPQRHRELERLGLIYGKDYAHQVREEVYRIWEQQQETG